MSKEGCPFCENVGCTICQLRKIKELEAENAELRQRLAEVENPWVSVEDRLPPLNQHVIANVYNPYNKDAKHWVIADVFHNGNFWCGTGHVNVTHWMPLPSTKQIGDL